MTKHSDGHVISGFWLTGSLASVVSRLRETGLAGPRIVYICIVFLVAITLYLIFSYSDVG